MPFGTRTIPKPLYAMLKNAERTNNTFGLLSKRDQKCGKPQIELKIRAYFN